MPLLPVVSQSLRGYPSEVDLVYEGIEATLRIRAVNENGEPKQLLGPGIINLRLAGYEPEVVELTCEVAQQFFF